MSEINGLSYIHLTSNMSYCILEMLIYSFIVPLSIKCRKFVSSCFRGRVITRIFIISSINLTFLDEFSIKASKELHEFIWGFYHINITLIKVISFHVRNFVFFMEQFWKLLITRLDTSILSNSMYSDYREHQISVEFFKIAGTSPSTCRWKHGIWYSR